MRRIECDVCGQPHDLSHLTEVDRRTEVTVNGVYVKDHEHATLDVCRRCYRLSESLWLEYANSCYDLFAKRVKERTEALVGSTPEGETP